MFIIVAYNYAHNSPNIDDDHVYYMLCGILHECVYV